MSILEKYSEGELRIHIKNMELIHAQLLADNTKLQVQYEQLAQAKNLLIDTPGNEEVHRALFESVQQYKELFNLNPLPMWIYDYETLYFLEVNEAAIMHYGYSREEFLSMTIKDLRPADDLEKYDTSVNQSHEHSCIKQGYWQHLKKNGELIQVEISGQAVKYGNKTAGLILSNDITYNKEIEQALETERKQLRTLIDNLPDAIYIKDADARKVITNKVDMAFMGVSSDKEVIGKTDTEIFEGEIGLRGYNDDIHILQTGEGVYNSEQFFVDVNGEGAWLLTSKVPLYNDAGKISGLLGIGRIITERKKAQELLAKERKLLRVLIDNLPDYIYIKDLESRHIINNKSNTELLGFTSESETLGKSVVDLLGMEAAGEFIKDDLKVFQSGESIINHEEPIKNKYGEQRWLLTTKIPLKDDNGHIVGLMGISRDITEQKIAAEELKEKNTHLKDLSIHLQRVREEERKSIAREIHDELGQLASVIKMDIDWLKLKMPDLEDAQQKRIDHALSTSELLLQSIRKIAFALRPAMLDELGLNASIEWQCKEFTRIDGIPCVFEQLCDDEGLSLAVKTELFRICQEALTNIMRHAHATEVIVTIQKKYGSKQLTIADNGIGFDISKKKNTLGLIGMRERALSVNGELTVKSEPGKGTIVSVAVPKIIYPI